MSFTKENSIEHVYYNDKDVGIECEYVYDDESNAKNTKDSIKDSCPENKRPTHKKTESNVYDELDYNLAPRIENHTEAQKVINDLTVSKDLKEKEINLKKKRVIVGALCICGILLAIVATAVGLQGIKVIFIYS